MGDTFDRVLEIAQEAKLKEICSFIYEYDRFLVPEEFSKYASAIIVREEVGEEASASWEGKLATMKAHFDTGLRDIAKKIHHLRSQNRDDLIASNRQFLMYLG